MRIKKLLVSLMLLVIILLGVNYSFAGSGELRFDQSSLDVHLYCTTPVVNLVVSGNIYNSYTADIPFVNGITFVSPNQTAATAFGSKTMNNGTCGSLLGCLRFVGSKDNGMLSGGRNGGTLTIQNSGYIRSAVVNITGYRQSVQSVVSSGLTDYTTVNGLLSLLPLNISLYPAPCNGDTAVPTFGFTGGMIPHVTSYTGPQFNDRIYLFDLRDMGGINDYGFYTGYNSDPWAADWTGGSDYSTGATVLNGSGVDLSTFTFQVAVETSPESSTFTSITLTGTYNITGAAAITGSTGGLVFYPYGFTWNRRNRNYTGYLLTGNLRPASTLDIDGYWTFGTEREVIMTGYVKDRANNTSALFTKHFNYGAIPRSSNKQASGSVASCGPNGSSTLGVSAPASDSGAYITKYNSYFVVEPFRVYLHDDRAGVDSGSVVVTLSGTQGGAPITIKLTGNVSPSVNLGLTPFTWVGPITVATAGASTQPVYSVSGSNRNYNVLVNYTGQWDKETKIEVFINYKDLVSRTGTQVSCSYVNTYAPYVNNWTGDVHLQRYPYASGGQLTGFVINVEDEWAGVNSGSIVLTISGRQVNNVAARTTSPILLVFTGSTNLSGWLSVYTTHPGTISGGQNYNYAITVPYNVDWTGYFAPEHPISITITYADLAGHIQTANKQYANLDNPAQYSALYSLNTVASSFTNTNSLFFDLNLLPFLTVFGSTINVIDTYNEWLDAFPIRTFANGYTGGITQFSGMQFGIFDYRAGVDSGYNFVQITGTRRGNEAKYVFATSDSTGLSWTGWTNCSAATNCVTGTMTRVAVQVTGYDTYNPQHPTIVQSTGYTFQISSGHLAYFDYGTYLNTGIYNIDVYLSDMRPDIPNKPIRSTGLQMETLACQFLNRCSHDMLTFVWGPDIDSDPNKTINQGPLTGDIDNPFLGSRVSIIGSGVSVDTGTHIAYCAGALGTPKTLDFSQVNRLGSTPMTGSYTNSTLKVADGLFELTGGSMDQLIVR